MFFFLFFMMGIFLVYSGSTKLKIFQKEKLSFMTTGMDKGVFINTSPQGGNGEFHVWHEPSPMIVFCGSHSVFEAAHTMVNMQGEITLTPSLQTGQLLLGGGKQQDLAGLFFLLGSLYMAFMGLTAYNSENYFFSFSHVIERLVILWVFFLVLCAGLFYVAGKMGLPFSPGDGVIFFYFCLYLLVYLSFFYAAGVFIRVVSRGYKAYYLNLIIFWVVSVLIVPPLLEGFLDKQTVDLRVAGNGRYSKQMQLVLERYEMASIFYPTAFYRFLNGEMSGNGFGERSRLIDHTAFLQEENKRLFLEKAQRRDGVQNAAQIAPVRHHVFSTKAKLPRWFTLALLIAGGYTGLLLTAAYFLLRRRKIDSMSVTCPDYMFQAGLSYFVLCQDETYKNALFYHYGAQKNWELLDNATSGELDPGLPLSRALRYFISHAGVDALVVKQNLQVLGVEIETLALGGHYSKKERAEIVFKLYVAVTMATDKEVIVVNDILKGKSAELEYRFLALVNLLNRMDKIIIFLSCEFYQTALPVERGINIHGYKSFKIDPRNVRLR